MTCVCFEGNVDFMGTWMDGIDGVVQFVYYYSY